MPILLDFSGTIYASVHVDAKGGEAASRKMLKHLIFNSLREYNSRFKHEYGELVICCDFKSWRTKLFPVYKYVRYNKEDTTDIDWDVVKKIVSEIIDDLTTHFPYRVIRVKWAEGDDVIATLAQRFSRMNQKVMIISNDKDMVSLSKNPLIKQYRPVMKKMYDDVDPKRHEFELFVRGDKDDGIPNIYCPDDFFKTQFEAKLKGEPHPRAKSITAKFLDVFWEIYCRDDENAIRLFLGDDTYRNYLRNKKLISMDMIPTVLVDEINRSYDNAKLNPIMGLQDFFNQNNMQLLGRELSSFAPQTMTRLF